MQKVSREIKAVFFDIDGTLISFKTHTMPDSTRRSLQALREKGIRLYIATGRAPSMMPFMDQYFTFDAYLTLNGQYCYGPSGVIRKQTIDVDDVRKLKALIREYHFPCLFVHEKGGSLNIIDERVRELYSIINHPLPEPSDLEAFPEDQVLQFVTFMPAGKEKLIMQELKHIRMTRFLPICFDAVPEGGGKDAGIRAVLECEHIRPEETMAFGDGHNDIGMLTYAGIGVAMETAEQAVKDAADYVTASVDDDGIAKALHHFGVL
ncbi:MAG: Cof-type HAD-IIB family hydrolase [Oxalobacter sp.]|nr:Cof-type HAD-IIB family hydrolase [Oxalobacter sp.]